MKLISCIIRPAAAGELEGLDLHEHGSTAYPEYLIGGSDSVILSVPAVIKEQAA